MYEHWIHVWTVENEILTHKTQTRTAYTYERTRTHSERATIPCIHTPYAKPSSMPNDGSGGGVCVCVLMLSAPIRIPIKLLCFNVSLCHFNISTIYTRETRSHDQHMKIHTVVFFYIYISSYVCVLTSHFRSAISYRPNN